MNILEKIIINIIELIGSIIVNTIRLGFNFNDKRLGNYNDLARSYLSDEFKKPNYKMAAKYFSLSVDNEDDDTACLSAAELARLYQCGYGVPQSNKKAAIFYELASKKAYNLDSEGKNNLGVYYCLGTAINKDQEKAYELFESANIGGFVNPCAVVNRFIFDKDNLLLSPNDNKEAILKIIEGAKDGDKVLQYKLGAIYEEGKHVKQDINRANKWFHKAAKNGHSGAERKITPSSGPELELAAKNGNKTAISILAEKNRLELEAERDEKIIRDAEQGNAVAQYELAVMCLHFRHYGFGGKLSRLTMQSAKQGYVKAQYLLGLLYEGGKYVPEDHPSTNGRVFGPIPQKIPDNFEPSPGSLFMMEDGIPPNYQKAIEWYLLAAKQGHETAKLRLKNLDGSINIDQDSPSWLEEEVPPWDEYEIPPWIQGGINTDVEASFKEYGISSIWHMTHKDNINEILTSGILSNTNAYAFKRPTDISDHSVQRWRDLEDPVYHRKLHDYVPTYLNIRNPMLYVRREIQHELCLIEISLSVLSECDFLFTDGNAAARNTKFYNTIDNLDKLPWDVLNASYWNEFPDGKRKRSSEVLVHPLIEPKHIIKLHCCSTSTLQYLSQFHIPVKISGELFFGKNSSSNTSPELSSFDDIPF